MEQYSQLSAYKHLLQVTQNILYSLQPDSQILLKYQSLKKAVFNKITCSNPRSTLNRKYQDFSQIQNQFNNQLSKSYKKLTQKMLQALTSFETQIQIQTSPNGDINDTRMNQSRNDDFVQQMKEVSKEVKYFVKQLKAVGISKNCIEDQRTSYEYQIQNSYCSNFMSKIQNFQLMAQVHRKMHQIIMKASYNQQEKAEKQRSLQVKLQQYDKKTFILEKQISKVNDARKFIEQHKLTEQSLNKYRIVARKLMKVLYE